MRNWKVAFFICLALLFISNFYLSYQLLDSEISNSYNGSTIERQGEAIKILAEIITEEGKRYSQKDVLFLLRQKYPDGFIVEDSNHITYEGINFIFENDTLINVKDIW